MRKTGLILTLLFASNGFSQVHSQKNLSGMCTYQQGLYLAEEFAFIELHQASSTVYYFKHFSDATFRITYGLQYQGIGLGIQLNRLIPETGHHVVFDSQFISEPSPGQKIFFEKKDALGQFVQYSCDLEVSQAKVKTE